MNSKRLPGKVLLPLNGHTVIGEVLTRCKRIPGVDRVVCAIPDTPENDELADYVYRFGPQWTSYQEFYLGPEYDVLARYYGAALKHEADIIIRVTGDCPLISPELCGAVLEKMKSEDADYASNIEPRTFPQGYDCEVFTMNTLMNANALAKPGDREHVTTWMRRAIDVHRVNVASPWPLEGRLTLDTEDDYRTICAYFGHAPYEHLRAA